MASSPSLSKANTSFTLALLTKLNDDDKTANIFFSPFSISSALAMVMLGARGNTATQMSEVLCFTEPKQPPESGGELQMQQQESTSVPQHLLKCCKPQNGDDDVHTKFAKLLTELNKPGAEYVLSVANRLYGEQSYQFEEAYLNETTKYYNAELKSVDFKNAAEEARVNINAWVEERTQGKIKDLLVKDTVDDLTRLVLINAIYFKGKWNEQFEESQTYDAEFRVNKNETKTVKMMRQTKSKFNIGFSPELNCKILEMPYKGKDLSMIIFLPIEIEDDTTGLEKLERDLTFEKFEEVTNADKMHKYKVWVSLPRFKLEETYDLNRFLKSMGMVDAFRDRLSNFSGISPANDLTVSKVVHKAYVEVNEEGTEAAAATGIGYVKCSMPPSFTADHPFLFFIRHNLSKSILFAGRFCAPI